MVTMIYSFSEQTEALDFVKKCRQAKSRIAVQDGISGLVRFCIAGGSGKTGDVLEKGLPDNIVLGIGFTSKAQGEGIEDFVHAEMAELSIARISAIATLSRSVMPPFLHRLAEKLGDIPIMHYTSARLEQEAPRLAHPSRAVYCAVGCHGVAEAAALSAAGPEAGLILEKTAFKGITFALAGRKMA